MSGSTSPAGSTRVRVDVDNRQQAHRIDITHLVGLLASTLDTQRCGAELHEAEVGLAFVSLAETAELNTAHMGGSGPTDVLAFPIDGVIPDVQIPPDQPAMLGDIVICPAVADKAPQALADELALLVVHGALHLVGHDHAEPDETALMQGLERDMLRRFHTS